MPEFVDDILIAFRYVTIFLVIPCGLVLLGSLIYLTKRHSRNKTIVAVTSIIISGLLIFTGYYSYSNFMELTDKRYRVELTIDGSPINQSEAVQVMIPLPSDFPGNYSNINFKPLGDKIAEWGNSSDYPHINLEFKETEHGDMLAITTNISLAVYTEWGDVNKIIRTEGPILTTEKDGKSPVYLSNSTHDVSLYLFHEYLYFGLLTNWEYHYVTISQDPPPFFSSYSDINIEQMNEHRSLLDPLLMEPGWQNVTLYSGEFTRTT